MEQIDLGNVCVLSAENLFLGQYIEIEGHLLKVTELEGVRVGLSPVTGKELFKYRFAQAWKNHKVLIIVCLGVFLITLFYIVRKLL